MNKIESHKDILNLWPSTAVLLKRIGEDFPSITADELKAIGHVLRNSKVRNKLTQPYWKYLIRVSTVDYVNKRITAMVTADLLMDMCGE